MRFLRAKALRGSVNRIGAKNMDAGRGAWPSADRAIASILLRDWYSSARLHYMSRIAVALVALLSVSLIGTVALINRPPQFRYILTSPTGQVLPQVPLDQPNHDDKYIVDWTIDAITRLYSFDFVNYRLQFQDAKKNMTTQGWATFEEAMQVSGNFNAVLGNKYVTTAVPTGPGKIIKSGQVLGRQAWKVEFPMLISYRSSEKDKDGKLRVTNQALSMAVTVIRQPIFLNEAGLGIRAIVAE